MTYVEKGTEAEGSRRVRLCRFLPTSAPSHTGEDAGKSQAKISQPRYIPIEFRCAERAAVPMNQGLTLCLEKSGNPGLVVLNKGMLMPTCCSDQLCTL